MGSTKNTTTKQSAARGKGGGGRPRSGSQRTTAAAPAKARAKARATTKATADACADAFFAPLANTRPWMRVGVLGWQGAGKTTLLALQAIHLHQRIRSTKPVAWIDTEGAAQHVKALFDAAGVAVVVRHTRSLPDLRDAIARAVAGAADIIVTDSLTHFWEDLVAAYLDARGVGELGPSDWVALKNVWHREWAEPFRDEPVHQLFGARAADVYVDVLDPDTGRHDSIKAGAKARGEAEIGFEASLLLELRRVVGEDDVVRRMCHVLKDRTRAIDGMVFADADGATFDEVITRTLAGAAEAPPVEQASASAYFAGGRPTRQAKSLVDELKTTVQRRWPGNNAADRQARAQALAAVAGTSSWQRLEGLSVEQLGAAVENLQRYIPPTPPPTGAVALAAVGIAARALDAADKDPESRDAAVAGAVSMAERLPQAERAQVLGLVERHKKQWTEEAHDQRDPWQGDDLPV